MKNVFIAATIAVTTGAALGGDFIQWTDSSVTFLHGTGFKVDPEDQNTVTLEHANGWKWGDFFWFHDMIHFNGDDAGLNGDVREHTYYGEIAPRVSLGKIVGKDLSVLFIKDWLLATCYEYGESPAGEAFGIQNGLIGAGVDLDVPFFDFFQANLYQRYDLLGSVGQSPQLTLVWKYSQPISKATFIFDGFMDWVVSDDGPNYSQNLHFCPQIKLDVGTIWGWSQNRLNVGVEYDYWSNKYGIKDSDAFPTTQSAISVIVKSHF